MDRQVFLTGTALAVLLAAAAPAAGQNADRIVVVGAPTDVAVTAADLEFRQANDLADIFRDIPSVSVGGSLGIAQKVYIRGVEDTLLNVTVDGAPQTGTLFHHIGRVNIEPELLQTVDVQTGAGEATSGFGAIGGALRFRTKDAADLLAPGQRWGGAAKAGYFSNDGYRTSVTGYGQLAADWSVLGSLVWVDRDNMKDGAGNTIFGSGGEQLLGFVKLSGEIAPGHGVSLSYERRDEEGEFNQRPNWPALATDPLYAGDGQRDSIVGNYRFSGGELLNVEATGYHTTSQFTQDIHDRWGEYGAEIRTWGFDLRNTSRFGAHEAVYGVEYRNDRVVSEYLSPAAMWQAWAWDPAVGRFQEDGEVWGAYVQNHLRVADPLLLSFGARYDAYDLEQVTYANGADSDGFSLNAGADYSITSALSLNAGYAQAMRGKEVGDAFTLEHRPGRIAIQPGLQPEEVENAEIGLIYDDTRLRASASYFDMRIDDVIMDQLGGGPAPQASVYYENVGRFVSQGVELRLGYSWDRFDADLFFTSYDAELNGAPVEGYEHIGLANASGDRWNFNFAWRPTSDFDLGLNLIHVADLNDIEVLHRGLEIGWIGALQSVDKPGYTVVDVYAEWRPRGDDSIRINVGVQNLFDELYRDHASVADYSHIPGWEDVAGLYEAGRDIRIGAAFAF